MVVVSPNGSTVANLLLANADLITARRQQKALRLNVLFLFDTHAVLFTVRILGASSYETRKANDTAWILVDGSEQNFIFVQNHLNGISSNFEAIVIIR